MIEPSTIDEVRQASLLEFHSSGGKKTCRGVSKSGYN